MKKTILLFLLIIYSNSFSQIIDVTEIELNFSGDSTPKHITKGVTKIYFVANDGKHGEQLWVHDILTNKSNLVIDLNASYNSNLYRPLLLTVGDILYFIPRIDDNCELWRSDGTELGTYLVKKWEDNSYFNLTGELLNYNNKIIFSAYDEVNGKELWISDGTNTGTKLVKDIFPGSANSFPKNFFVFEDNFYFVASNSPNNYELWKSNGTTDGTILLKEINPSTSGLSDTKNNFIIFKNNFYFYANNTINGNELWKSDGTTDGTQLLKDINTGGNGSGSDLIGYSTNSFFVFCANTPTTGTELWVSDGTVSGTKLLNDFNPNGNGMLNYRFGNPNQFALLNNKIYFTVNKSTFDFNGFKEEGDKLWVTDGTTNGTQLVKDFNFGKNISYIQKLISNGNFLIFAAKNEINDYNSLWKSDGTTSGTFELKDIDLTQYSNGELNFVPFNNLVFFPAGDESLNGIELWATDGTTENTNLFLDINHYYNSLGEMEDFAILSDKLFFKGNNGFGNKPFISDGTISGTNIIKDMSIASSSVWGGYEFRAAFFTKSGNSIFFKAYNGTNGNEIWKTDGTEENTKLVKDIYIGKSGSITDTPLFIDFNDNFYLSANDGIHGQELWRSDGTENGTYLLKDIKPGIGSGINQTNIFSNHYNVANYNYHAVLNNNLYFTADDGTDISIWKTDGTSNGTLKAIKIPNNATNVEPKILTATNKKIFFTTSPDYNDQNKLWSSDGTQSGTIQLITLSVNSNENFRKSVVLNNNLYFTAHNSSSNSNYDNQLSLLKSDGSITGTTVVAENFTIYNTFNSLIACGNYIYFTTGSELYSTKQLWRTDGTKNGTVKLGEIELGVAQNYLNCNCHQNNLLYTKDLFDKKIWYVNENSTNDSTYYEVNVTNSNNFIEYEGVSDFKSVNNTLFFIGSKSQTGRELYSTNFDFHSNLNTQSFTNNLNSKLLIYPNPSTNRIKVNIINNEEITTVKLFDLLGEEVLSSENKSEYDISGITNGIYIIKVFTNESDYNSKIIIRK